MLHLAPVRFKLKCTIKVSLVCITDALRKVFTRLDFEMVVYNDLTAENIRFNLQELGGRNFRDHDALVSNVTHLKII